MPLYEVQSVLARLYTDSDFRRQFFESPAQACSEFQLTPDDLNQLQNLDRKQVDRFAKSLLCKRASLVREQLPALVTALGNSFGKLFSVYSEENPSVPEPAEDSQAFLAFLSKTRPKSPAYVADLVRLEILRYQLPHGDRSQRPLQSIWRPRITNWARVATLGYDMEPVYAALLKGQTPEPARDRCTILIGSVNGRIKLRRLNEPTTRLLKLCNGVLALEEITERVADSLGLTGADRLGFAAESATFLKTLGECGLCE